MKRFLQIAISLSVVLLLITCKSSLRVTKTNLAYIYFEDPTIIHPSYKVFHKNEDISSLYVQLQSSEILYSKNNSERIFLSRLIFHVKVFELGNENKLVTSDTLFLQDVGGPDANKYLQGSLDLELPAGEDYFAELTLDDRYRMQFVQDIILIRKKKEFTSQHVIVKNLKGDLLFGETFPIGTALKMELSPATKSRKLELRYYSEQTKLPAPPFVVKDDDPYNPVSDSSMIVRANEQGDFEINLDRRGIYQFTQADLEGDGMSLVVLGQDYPNIQSISSMIGPLKYITTKQEYTDIIEGLDRKKEIDAFWYNIAGNSEKARETIKSYYSRVEIANTFFTSDREGWRSDRGLVYMIYGPPNSVTKSVGRESWVYNEKVNMMAIEFNFIKLNNPFTDNDYVMTRAGGYKSSWYRAIDNWRQGRIF